MGRSVIGGTDAVVLDSPQEQMCLDAALAVLSPYADIRVIELLAIVRAVRAEVLRQERFDGE